MPTLSEQLANIGQTNLETVMRLTTISFHRTERLVQLQSETVSLFLEENNRALEPQERAESSAWSRIYPANLQRATDVTRSYLEMALQTQTELSQMWSEQFDVLSKGLSQNLEQWADALSTGSEEAIAAFQNLTARANEATALLREQAEMTNRAVEGTRELESRAIEEARDGAAKAKKSKSA